MRIVAIEPKPFGIREYPLQNALYPIKFCKNRGIIVVDAYSTILAITSINVSRTKLLSLNTDKLIINSFWTNCEYINKTIAVIDIAKVQQIQSEPNQSALFPLSKNI